MNYIALLYFKKTMPICVQYICSSQGNRLQNKNHIRRKYLAYQAWYLKRNIELLLLLSLVYWVPKGRSGKEKGREREGRGEREWIPPCITVRVSCLWESWFGSGLEYCQRFHFKLPSSFPFMFHRPELLLKSWKESRNHALHALSTLFFMSACGIHVESKYPNVVMETDTLFCRKVCIVIFKSRV